MSETDLANLLLKVIPAFMASMRNELRGFTLPEVSVPQFRILGHLSQGGTLTNSELAEASAVDITSMSRMVDGLIKKGFVSKTQAKADRRKNHVEMTTKGQSLYAKKKDQFRKLLEKKIQSSLPREEQAQLAAGLSVLEKLLR